MIDRLRLASLNVPRYTSYPTAPHFSAAVRGDTVERWLGELAPDARISAYFHVPFCQSMCFYCGCNTKLARKMAPVDLYTDHLIQELEHVSTASAAHGVTDVHWGGGTPSALGAANLRRLWAAFAARFDLSHLSHHAMELDPRVLTAEFVAVMAEIGINRVSFGLQDFNADVQEAIGRVQPLDKVQEAFALVRNAGIDNINVDLIYGLPHQTLAHLQDNIRQTAALNPDRVSVFGYAHVPWMKKHQRLIDEAALPNAEARMEQADAVNRLLIEAGYVAIGMDHYAKADDALCAAAEQGALHRNFQGYTTDCADALIGFGASAISTLPQGYAQNEPTIGPYSQAIAAGRLATCRGHAFSRDDKIRGALIERLMCNFSVDMAEIAPEADLTGAVARLHALAQDGLVHIHGSQVRMTEAGRPFVRVAAQAFDAYSGSAAQFSRAV